MLRLGENDRSSRNDVVHARALRVIGVLGCESNPDARRPAAITPD